MTTKLQGLRRRIHRTTNLRVRRMDPLPSPAQVKADLPMTEEAWKTVSSGRRIVQRIIHGDSTKFMLVLGPCSVHSVDECLEYGKWVVEMRNKYPGQIYFVMRGCLVKPRTRPDWFGYCSDPDLDGSCDIEKGWRQGRKLILTLNEMGVPCGWEYNDIPTQQHLDDLPSFLWLGAREVTNQDLRKAASALSCPVGIKNPVSGSIQPAIDTLMFAQTPHVLPAISDSGVMARFETAGNPDGVLILRGTSQGQNYEGDHVAAIRQALTSARLPDRLLVDFSHGNSGKDYRLQRKVSQEVTRLVLAGAPIRGGLYESYLVDGNQKFAVTPGVRPSLQRGVSITDSCDGLARSEELIAELHEALKGRKKK